MIRAGERKDSVGIVIKIDRRCQPRSDEVKAKISTANKGKKMSIMARARMRTAKLGGKSHLCTLWADPEWRARTLEKIRARMKARWEDPTFRARMGERLSGYNKERAALIRKERA